MQIEKGGRIYNVTETEKQWNLKIDISKVEAVYNVSKDICKTFEDLKKHVSENDIF